MSNSGLSITPPRTSGFTTSTTHPLYWARWGPAGADPLLVLHGGPGAHHDYLLPQMLELSEHEMVFYDQRGGGQSKTDGRDHITWETHVEDLALVANELITGPFTLVGYSWGGLLAMLALTSGLKAHVSRLVLIAPASPSRAQRRVFEDTLAEREKSEWVRTERGALVTSGLRERDPEAYRKRGFELSVAGYFADPTRARDLTPFRVTSRVQQSVWESLGDFDLLPKLRGVQIPALVLHGRQDPIPLASSQSVADALHGRLVVLDDCGHVPYVECATPFFSAVRTFLQETARVAE